MQIVERLPKGSLSEPRFPSSLDASLLTLLKACPRKFYWRAILGLDTPYRNIDLHAGSCVASAMETYRNLIYSGEDREDSYVRGFETLIKCWGDRELPEGSKSPKTFFNTSRAWLHYIDKYPPEDDIIQPLKDRKCTEFSFAVPLPVNNPDTGEPLFYTGRFDLLGTYALKYAILDDKTTSHLGDAWQKQWDIRYQFLGYIWAMRELGYKVDHIIVRGIGIKKTEPDLLQKIVTPPSYLVDRWKRQMIYDVVTAVQMYESGYFPFDFASSCSAFGGCGYKLLCTAKEPKHWYDEFVINHWSPLNEKEKES